MITHASGVWTVPLGANHAPYPLMKLKRRFAGLDDHTVVVVDTAKLMEAFARDTLTIPPATQWPADKLAHHCAFLNPVNGIPEMPILYCEETTTTRRVWWGLFGTKTQTVPVVGFTNGRHRARYLEFAGAAQMPVETLLSNAALLRHYCGAA
ncbi:plasmid fertility inhibition factor family protein [Cupriavidus basilensis]